MCEPVPVVSGWFQVVPAMQLCLMCFATGALHLLNQAVFAHNRMTTVTIVRDAYCTRLISQCAFVKCRSTFSEAYKPYTGGGGGLPYV